MTNTVKSIELSANCKLELASAEVSELGIGTVKGKVSEADVVNANGFLIELSEMQDMINSPLNQDRLNTGKMYGCVGHDERPVENNDIRKGLVSHVIRKLWMDGKDVFCEATILGTDSGKNLLACLKGGGFMQASTRLSVKEVALANGVRGLVGADSEILTIDFVIDPALDDTYIKLASQQKAEDKITSSELKLEMSSVELDVNIAYYKGCLERERELNNILKSKKIK